MKLITILAWDVLVAHTHTRHTHIYKHIYSDHSAFTSNFFYLHLIILNIIQRRPLSNLTCNIIRIKKPTWKTGCHISRGPIASARPTTRPAPSTPRYLLYPDLKAILSSPAGTAVSTSSGDGPSPVNFVLFLVILLPSSFIISWPSFLIIV